MPVNNLNFIPESVSQERKIRHTKVIGTRFSIAIMIFFVLGSAGIWLYNANTDKKINQIKTEIEQKNSEIIAMRQIGEDGYKLGARLNNAQKIINTRQHISKLMEQLSLHTPDKIGVQSWSFDVSQNLIIEGISLGGYVSIDDFRVELLLSIGNNDKALFKDVTLNSAEFKKENGVVKFKMTGYVNSEALYGTNN